jgi:hypothetical protein
MFDWVAAAVEAGGASALSFSALGALILGYLANRWFSGDHVAVKVFIYLTMFLGIAGVYYTQLVDKADIAEVLERRASEEQAKPEPDGADGDADTARKDAPPEQAGSEKPASDAAPQPSSIPPNATAAQPAPSVAQPASPQMPLDELARLSDEAYDRGEYQRAFDLNAEGCSRGAGISCRWNGYLLESNKGFQVNLAESRRWYVRGCSLGNAESCERKVALAGN